MTQAISPSETQPTRVRAAARAARALLHVATRPRGTGPTDTADALGIAVPTAYHLLATLADEGLLARDGRGGFVLGPRVGVLADAYLRDGAVPPYLAEPLRQLAEQAGETAYLTAWRGGEIHALDSVEGAGAVRVAGVARGPYRAPHARATGKLMLAFARGEVRAAMLGDAPLEAVTDRTITDRDALERELAAIRRRGWAEDHEEYAEGVSCVAAPVDVDGVVIAAYTIAAPTERFRRRHDALLAAVKRAAARAAAPHHDRPEDA